LCLSSSIIREHSIEHSSEQVLRGTRSNRRCRKVHDEKVYNLCLSPNIITEYSKGRACRTYGDMKILYGCERWSHNERMDIV